jgi:hypothetical protein
VRYRYAVPRGNPKQVITLRIDPATIETVRGYGVPFTQAVEEGIAWWLARQRRRDAKAEPEAASPARKRRTA